MVRSRPLRFLLAWLVLVTGFVGTARGALGLGCRHQGQVESGDDGRPGAAIALGALASGSGTLTAAPSRDSQESVPPAPAALASACTPAPALPTRTAHLAPTTPEVREVAPWRPKQHVGFVPPPPFHPPRLS
jgi:hypothetical protein